MWNVQFIWRANAASFFASPYRAFFQVLCTSQMFRSAKTEPWVHGPTERQACREIIVSSDESLHSKELGVGGRESLDAPRGSDGQAGTRNAAGQEIAGCGRSSAKTGMYEMAA